MERSLMLLPKQLRQKIGSSWKAIAEIEAEMDRWFKDKSLLFNDVYKDIDFTPPLEFTETKKEYLMKVEIPGVRKEDVKIELEGDLIIVSGEKNRQTPLVDENADTEESSYSEAYYGTFIRTFSLPNDADKENISAQFENGELLIRIPKTDGKESTEIAIS